MFTWIISVKVLASIMTQKVLLVVKNLPANAGNIIDMG